MQPHENVDLDPDYDLDTEPTPRRNDRGRARLRTLSDLDQRTRAAKLARQLVANLESDLGGELSTAKRQLVTRAALLGAMIEDAEARWLESRPADLGLYGTLVDRQRRVLEALGLDRRARQISPIELDKLIDAVREGSL
jgi:hypothetical protein